MPTDPNRVKEIFLGATEQPDETARLAYLDRACGDDAALRDRVAALLRSHDPAGSFLGTPAVPAPELDNGATQELGSAAPPDETNEADDDLKFLDKPRRADSLGRLGHYEILQVLGRGGFGIVFRAFDDTLQRVVAIKVMAPQIATLSPARRRFVREARSSAAVRHENVVQVYEVGEQPLPYLAMEFIPGETLQQKLDRSGPLEVSEILRIGRQIAEGLAAAHACDLIHRDIKPGNVLLEGGSHKAKITDFGLARAADDASISQSGIIAGTPMFMAPEQALGHHIDQRADLFSLGSVLYQMASGRPPFRAPSALAVLKRVAEEPPRPIAEIIPETPDWLCGIVAKLHAKNPVDRFQSAREVADLLADCEAKLKAKQEATIAVPGAPSRVSGRIERPRASAGAKWVAAAAVLLLPMIVLAVTEFTGVTHLFWQPVATDPDRRAAEYVLSIRGQVQVDGRDRRISAVAELPRDPFRLTWVGLMHSNQVSETGLANFKDCRNLTFLGLFDTSVSDEGLANFQDCKNLTFVNLSRTKISDAGLANFKNCPELTIVVLSETKVSDTGLAYLKNSKKLTNLLLQKTKVTAAGIDDLKKALPLCKIEWSGAVSAPPPPLADGWIRLFNGKDTTGWKINPDQGGLWEVRDGILTGSSRQSYLFSERGDYVNFHLLAEARINLGGDSGIHFRAPFDLQSGKLAWQVGPNGGYEAELQKSPTHLNPTGSVQEVRAGERPIVLDRTADDSLTRPDEWFTLEIIAEQNRFITKVNGKETANCSDPLNKYPRGHIALQVWTPNTVVQFRKIEIKELPPISPPPTFKNSLGMEFVIVPKGKSWLGGGKDKPGDKEVEIPADFYLGKYEVTQEEWEKVMGKNPSHFSRTGGGSDAVKEIQDQVLQRFPVDNVSWSQAKEFAGRVNERLREHGWVYRLPTESEWEYACRGGPSAFKDESGFDYYLHRPTNAITGDQANFSLTGLRRTCKVGSYPANRLGLHDMHGNAWEWCDGSFDGRSRPVRRSGSFFEIPSDIRAVTAHGDYAAAKSFGLRLARVPSPQPAKLAPVPMAKQELPPTFKNSLGMEFVIVPKGKSWLGGGKDKPGDKEVEIPADFYLGKYEVTQEEWAKVMGENPSHFARTGEGKDAVKDIPDADLKRFPVESVSWDQCRIFVAKLNSLEKEKDWVHRLPTEAEWEYACRGGPMADKVDSAFDFYLAKPTNTLMPEQANFDYGLNRTGKVGSYDANRLGLFDMHGNVWEWCDDFEKAADGGARRVLRGGGWFNPTGECRAASRFVPQPSTRYNNLGLRLARVPSGAVSPEAKTPPP